MRVLVTGATGFIGREIVFELIENNYQVIGLKNSEENSFEFPAVKFFKADITDYKNLLELETLRQIDVIIHSAGLAHQFGDTKREQFEAVNVKGTENVLNLGVKLNIKHFILIGSTAVYGTITNENDADRKPAVIKEDAPTNPLTLYAKSKLESEDVCRRVCEANEIALTIFRLAPVIGEANVGNVARLIGSIDKGRFVWIGDGRNLKTLIYKRDVARACAELIEKKRFKTEIFNLAAEPVKMKDFVLEISTLLNKKIIPVKIPAYPLRKIFQVNSKIFKLKKVNKISETVEKWLSDDIYSADKIANAYGFRPQTSIFEAVAQQINHYKKGRE